MRFLRHIYLICVPTLLLAGAVLAESVKDKDKASNNIVSITVDQSNDSPIRIAVVPFKQLSSKKINRNIADMVRRHFSVSGLLVTTPVSDMLSLPYEISQVHYQDWKDSKSEYLLMGVIDSRADKLVLRIILVDIVEKRHVMTDSIEVSDITAVDVANSVANKAFKKITGINGIFESRFSFVEERRVRVKGKVTAKLYTLKIVNINGENEQVVFRSFKPIWSPAWSNDNKKIAYVSFVNQFPTVKIYDFATKKHYPIGSPHGTLTSSPAWSKDDRKLIVTVNKRGNADLAVFNFAKHSLRKITRHSAIDTEAAWSPNGQRAVYMSDRFGAPQIMEYSFANKRSIRLTNDKYHSANPSYIDDETLLFVRKSDNDFFNLFVMDINTGFIRQLTHEKQDVESVSISPNGHYAVYTVTTPYISKLKIVHIRSKKTFAFFKLGKGRSLRSASWSRL